MTQHNDTSQTVVDHLAGMLMRMVELVEDQGARGGIFFDEDPDLADIREWRDRAREREAERLDLLREKAIEKLRKALTADEFKALDIEEYGP